MELKRDDIIKALELCGAVDADILTCGRCPFEPKEKVKGSLSCNNELIRNALSLIKELADAEAEAEKAIDIAEDNIRAEIASGGTSCHWCEDKVRADTVREVIALIDKMFDRQRYESKWIDNSGNIRGCVDIGSAHECWIKFIKLELKKEMLEGEDGTVR